MSNHDLADTKQQSPKKEKHKATRRQKYLMLSGATTFLIVVALVLIYAAISILGLLFGDILMAILDPRISFTKKEGAR